ncbi:hypothetical protein [Antribacter gilvus]|uniref:hypothetical protein n=1 Tax=Antribacter gilvus TaxID=2304675 RepID=UPI000F785023|nr:hypothetical protein [Antribacter gilvus]
MSTTTYRDSDQLQLHTELVDCTRLVAYLCGVPLLDVRAQEDQVDVGHQRVEVLTVAAVTADLAAAGRMARLLHLSPTPPDGDSRAWAGWIPDVRDEPFSVRITVVEAGA